MLSLELLQICLALIDNEPDRIKFEALYQQYDKLLRYLAGGVLKEDAHTEDAASIAWMKIAQNIHMIDDVDSDRTKHLLKTVVRNVALNMLKREKMEQRLQPEWLEEPITAGGLDEFDSYLADAILQLPSPYQEVILLKYADGYNNREIAAMLELTLSNTEKIVSRGRKKLQSILEKEEGAL